MVTLLDGQIPQDLTFFRVPLPLPVIIIIIIIIIIINIIVIIITIMRALVLLPVFT